MAKQKQIIAESFDAITNVAKSQSALQAFIILCVAHKARLGITLPPCPE
jgi:hypothetical protein